MAISTRAALRQYIWRQYAKKSTVYNPYGWEADSLFIPIPLSSIRVLDLEKFAVQEATWKNQKGVVFSLGEAAESIKYYPRTFANFMLESGCTVSQSFANQSFNELQKTFELATHDKVVTAQGKTIFGDWTVVAISLEKVKFIHPDAFAIIGDSTAWVCFISHSRQKTHKMIEVSFNESLLYSLASAYLFAPSEIREMADALWEQRQPLGSKLKDEAQHIVDEVNEREAF